ncbi:unnamed protein product [Allacma fusca]|uniref:Uncharacterized protein n=1 Tax=Allacma fusca TaxID=39272 RepID=A0A8J2JYB0_9HEXA|nr:unnamed protein product [Allacma fusca]
MESLFLIIISVLMMLLVVESFLWVTMQRLAAFLISVLENQIRQPTGSVTGVQAYRDVIMETTTTDPSRENNSTRGRSAQRSQISRSRSSSVISRSRKRRRHNLRESSDSSDSRMRNDMKLLKNQLADVMEELKRSRRRRSPSYSSRSGSVRSRSSYLSIFANGCDNTNFTLGKARDDSGEKLVPDAIDVSSGEDDIEILGLQEAAKVEKTKFADPINDELAKNWNVIATAGLSEQHRSELEKLMFIPSNTILIGAPELNPELKAGINISDYVFNRDVQFAAWQKIIGGALSELGRRASQMLLHLQHSVSATRRQLIVSNLKPEVKKVADETTIDKYLFSAEFQSRIKAQEELSKVGQPAPVVEINSSPGRAPTIQHSSGLPSERQPSTLNKSTSPERQTIVTSRDFIRSALLTNNVPIQAADTILHSLADSTWKQYEISFKSWSKYCDLHNFNIYDITIHNTLQFLQQLYNNGQGYSSLNSARSFLSLVSTGSSG